MRAAYRLVMIIDMTEWLGSSQTYIWNFILRNYIFLIKHFFIMISGLYLPDNRFCLKYS